MKSISQLCEEAYETAELNGWNKRIEEFGTRVALIHTELSEAIEADRRMEGKDRITEELADACIRIFNVCGLYGFKLEKAINEKMEKNKNRSYLKEGKVY